MKTEDVPPAKIARGDVIQSHTSPTYWLRATSDATVGQFTSHPDGDKIVYSIEGVLVEPADKAGAVKDFNYLSTLSVTRRVE